MKEKSRTWSFHLSQLHLYFSVYIASKLLVPCAQATQLQTSSIFLPHHLHRPNSGCRNLTTSFTVSQTRTSLKMLFTATNSENWLAGKCYR